MVKYEAFGCEWLVTEDCLRLGTVAEEARRLGLDD